MYFRWTYKVLFMTFSNIFSITMITFKYSSKVHYPCWALFTYYKMITINKHVKLVPMMIRTTDENILIHSRWCYSLPLSLALVSLSFLPYLLAPSLLSQLSFSPTLTSPSPTLFCVPRYNFVISLCSGSYSWWTLVFHELSRRKLAHTGGQ